MLIAHTTLTKPTATRVLTLNGVSEESWGDAVWQAIAAVLSSGCRVAGLNVLRHSMTSHGGRIEYHVNVNLVPAQ